MVDSHGGRAGAVARGTAGSEQADAADNNNTSSSPRGAGQQWKPKHFSKDIYISNLRIRQAEQMLTPLSYNQQQARGHG